MTDNDYYTETHYRRPNPKDREEWEDSRHKADRTEYDTPGSVRYCACESCNTERRIHGKEPLEDRLRVKIFKTTYDDGRAEEYRALFWRGQT